MNLPLVTNPVYCRTKKEFRKVIKEWNIPSDKVICDRDYNITIAATKYRFICWGSKKSFTKQGYEVENCV